MATEPSITPPRRRAPASDQPRGDAPSRIERAASLPLADFIDSALESATNYGCAAEEIDALVDVTENEISYVRNIMRTEGEKASVYAHAAYWRNVSILIGMAREKAEAIRASAEKLEVAAMAARRQLAGESAA